MAASGATIAALGAGLIAAAAPAQASIGQVQYFVSDGHAIVGTGPNSPGTGCGVGLDCPSSITIPDQVEINSVTYTVTAIADKAFYGKAEISSVDLSQATHLTDIGLQAFYEGGNSVSPHGPSSVTLGYGVTAIHNLAFAGTALQHLDLPFGVQTIGGSAFSDIPELQTVQVGSNVTSIGNAAFASDTGIREVHFLGARPTFAQGIFDNACATPCSLRYTHAEAASWLNTPDEASASSGQFNTWVDTDVPTITVPPDSKTVTSGANATFHVTATGDGPLSYQWRRADADIEGANSSSLTVHGVGPTDDEAQYTVVVSNWVGPNTSSAATLHVTPPVKPVTRKPQSIRKVPAVLRNHRTALPVKTVQGQRITWSVKGPGHCRVSSVGRVNCRAATGRRTVAFTAKANRTASLLAFTQAVRRPVK